MSHLANVVSIHLSHSKWFTNPDDKKVEEQQAHIYNFGEKYQAYGDHLNSRLAAKKVGIIDRH